MHISDIERLILINQYKILAKLDNEDEARDYHSKKAEILENGYEWYYPQILTLSETLPKEISSETIDILMMFRQLDAYIDQLPEEQRKSLDLSKLAFDGFDGNNDPHYSFASFIIEKDDRFIERKGKSLNSHNSMSIRKYRKMLLVYNERKKDGHLTFDDLKAIQGTI